ncbi:CDGSH iron-sulfur domain-containing protein [Dankookia sp. P2]|uniref:CDGSH iron-sulfur domain-containing protein n=1 Tax=Dankookia sp. P2 TaxID=3423955 RepID=UPI003D6722C5
MTDAAPQPTIAQKAPYPVTVEAGKSYWWCTCGNLSKQPFCDGTHKGGAFAPLKYTAEKDGQVWFCGCKASAKAPLCDGRHKAL